MLLASVISTYTPCWYGCGTSAPCAGTSSDVRVGSASGGPFFEQRFRIGATTPTGRCRPLRTFAPSGQCRRGRFVYNTTTWSLLTAIPNDPALVCTCRILLETYPSTTQHQKRFFFSGPPHCTPCCTTKGLPVSNSRLPQDHVHLKDKGRCAVVCHYHRTRSPKSGGRQCSAGPLLPSQVFRWW